MAEVKMPGDETRTKGAESMLYRDDYPRNSIPEGRTVSASTEDAPKTVNATQPPRPKRVTTGKVVKRKKSMSQKLIKTFTGEDVVDVKGFLIDEVILPTVKNLICDIFEYGPQMILFGDVRASDRRRDRRSDRRRNYTSYDRIYQSSDSRRDREPRRDRRSQMSPYNDDDVILKTRGEAELLISNLCDRIEDYGSVTIADLNDMLGMTSSNFTDCYWGWDDRTGMRRATYRRVRDGWLLILPEAVNLR